MPNQFIKELVHISELSYEDWRTLCMEPKLDNADLKALSRHTGIELKTLSDVLNQPSLLEDNFMKLHEIEIETTHNIKEFQNAHPNLNEFNIKTFELSRAQWNMLILKFNQQKKQSVTRPFLVEALCSILKLQYSEVNCKLKHSSTMSLRPKYLINSLDKPIKKPYYHSLPDHDSIPIIDENELIENGHKGIIEKLEEKEIRITPLHITTPTKAPHDIHNKKTTPGGTRVKALLEINGLTLFTTASPEKKEIFPKNTMVTPDIQTASAITFTVTPESIKNREQIQRVPTKRTMGAPAYQIFDSVGLKNPTQKTQEFHWAHLAAHSFIDPADIHYVNSDEDCMVNLVPSTAVANYNTLVTVENFIRNKLAKKDTDKIQATVTPLYNKDTPKIPFLLTYKLEWVEEELDKSQLFYIYPQSSRPIYKNENNAIHWLQNETETNSNQSRRR